MPFLASPVLGETAGSTFSEEAETAEAPVRSAPHLGQDVGQGVQELRAVPAVATALLGLPIGVLTPLAKTDIFYHRISNLSTPLRGVLI